jgi:hypothetical protein
MQLGYFNTGALLAQFKGTATYVGRTAIATFLSLLCPFATLSAFYGIEIAS